MKINKFVFGILIIFILGFTIIPFIHANSDDIGYDPKDDILKSDLLHLDNMQDWMDSKYFGVRYPDFKWLYDVHPGYFDVKEGPNCVDVVEWGINNYGNNISSLYVEVEDITDYMDKDYFSIDILIIYEDISNYEEIKLFGELEFTDDDLIDNDYKTNFNYGETNHSYVIGEVGIYTTNNSYEIYFDTSWITETDTDTINDNMYGIVLGYCWKTSARENISRTYFDFFPNSYYGQEFADEEEEDDYTYPFMEPVAFIVIILILLLIIFFAVVLFNKKGGGRKRRVKVGEKTFEKTKNITSIFYFVFAAIVMLVILLVTLGIITVV